MTITIPVNGTGSTSIIHASHFQQFSDLLQGGMQDVIVKILQNLELLAIAATPAAPTFVSLQASSTGVDVGVHNYSVTFQSGDGETLPSPLTAVTVTTGNRWVNLTIPASPIGTTATRLWRTKLGGSQPFLLYTSSTPNAQGQASFSYQDQTPDASLSTTTPPSHPSFGGSLLLKDSSGNLTLQVNNDGSIVTGNAAIIDPSNGHDTLINAAHTGGTGNIQIQVGGVTQVQIDGSGGKILNGGGNATILDFSAGTDVTLNAPNSGGGHKVVFTVGGTRVASIDSSGNMVLKGSLTQNGTP